MGVTLCVSLGMYGGKGCLINLSVQYFLTCVKGMDDAKKLCLADCTDYVLLSSI